MAMICSSLNRLLRTTPPLGPGRAILNGRSLTYPGLISGGQVRMPQEPSAPAAGLRCELQLGREDALTADSQSHFHFLLFSERNGLKVYDEWNMWGYFARTFDLTVAGTNNYQVTRRDR